MSTLIQVLKHTRIAIHNAVKNLTSDQLLAIPEGFDNNIAWNLGHLMIVQQRIIYGRSGLDLRAPAAMWEMYKPGTSPADWDVQPDALALVEMLLAHQQMLEDDYAAGKFVADFEPMITSTQVFIDTLDGGLMFNNYHEGLHYGTILSLKNFIM